MKRIAIMLTILLIGLSNLLTAQNDSLPKHKLLPRPPIYGIPAKTLPKGHFIYRSYFVYTQYNKMLNTTTDKMVSLPSQISYYEASYTPKLRYGLTNNLTLICNIPLEYKAMTVNSSVKKGAGLGDIIAAALYRFYFNRQKKFLVSALLFTKLPTGKAKNLATDELPLGSGTFDYGLAIMPEKELGKIDMRWSAFYLRRGTNPAGVNLGDMTMLSWSAAYTFSPKFIAEATLLYKYLDNNSKNGNVLPRTYMYTSQFILGGQYRISRTFLVQAAVPVNLYSHIKYSSPYDIWLGFYKLF